MSRYDNDFIPLAPTHQVKVPITYHHIYHFAKKKIKKDVAFYGVRVEVLNTSSFFTSGHYKPISKIIDINVFNTLADDNASS